MLEELLAKVLYDCQTVFLISTHYAHAHNTSRFQHRSWCNLCSHSTHWSLQRAMCAAKPKLAEKTHILLLAMFFVLLKHERIKEPRSLQLLESMDHASCCTRCQSTHVWRLSGCWSQIICQGKYYYTE